MVVTCRLKALLSVFPNWFLLGCLRTNRSRSVCKKDQCRPATSSWSCFRLTFAKLSRYCPGDVLQNSSEVLRNKSPNYLKMSRTCPEDPRDILQKPPGNIFPERSYSILSRTTSGRVLSSAHSRPEAPVGRKKMRKAKDVMLFVFLCYSTGIDLCFYGSSAFLYAQTLILVNWTLVNVFVFSVITRHSEGVLSWCYDRIRATSLPERFKPTRTFKSAVTS